MFTVDLQRGARCVLRFLSEARLPLALKTTCEKRYPAFLRLQSTHLAERLIAPPDVALVWFSHMLQSKEYQTFAACFGLQSFPHCSTIDVTPELLHKSQQLWDALSEGASCLIVLVSA
jgi:hypothetical protein